MPTDNDVKVERAKMVSTLAKIFGPALLVALGLGSYTVSNRAESVKKHAQSEKGYELLATMVNQHEQRLDTLERQKASASQPALNLGGPIIIPGGRVDPYGLAKAVGKAPPRKDGATVLVNPKYRPAPAVPKKAPPKLGDIR